MFIQSQHVFRTCSVCAIYQPNQRRLKLSTPDQPLNNAHLQPHARQPFLIAINTPTFLRLARVRESERANERAHAMVKRKTRAGKPHQCERDGAHPERARHTSGYVQTVLCAMFYEAFGSFPNVISTEEDAFRACCCSRLTVERVWEKIFFPKFANTTPSR